MKTIVAAVLTAIALCTSVYSQTTAFTYQGHLKDASVAANGTYPMQFSLWDAASDGSQIGSTITFDGEGSNPPAVQVTNGVFTVQLDFMAANAFDGDPRWLAIAVRKPTDPPGFTTLGPRQSVTSAPYAVKSLNAASADSLSSACQTCVDSNQILSLFGGKVTGPVQSAINANFANFANDSSQLGGQSSVFYARLNNPGTQTFSGNNTFSGNVLYTGSANFQTTVSAFGIIADAARFVQPVQIDGLASAGTTPLCRNSSSLISACAPLYVDLSSTQTVSGFKTFTTGVGGNGAGLTNLNGAAINPSTNITAQVINASQVFAGNMSATSGIIAGSSRFTGTVEVDALGTPGGTPLCRNGANLIAACSLSLRYQTNVAGFSPGLSLIRQLRPIAFDWQQSGTRDVGFGAEDVAKVEPLLVTYNSAGEVEGVKYDRLSVIFVNAFKELQDQIERQQKLIEAQQRELGELKVKVQHLTRGSDCPTDQTCK